MTAAPAPRVALVSVGIGRIQRGFERYFRDLFASLQGSVDVTLFKGAGSRGEGETVPPMLRAATRFVRMIPWRKLDSAAEYPQYKRDCLAYALALLPDLLRNRFDVVHVIDPPLAAVLTRLGRLLPIRPRLLFTEGSVMPPDRYPAADHIHHVARETWRGAIEYGHAESWMTMIPCGIDPARFEAAEARDALRDRHGIPREAFVVLVVSAQKREHKRVDHVIREVAAMAGEPMLWIDGNPQDPAIPRLADELLGGRARVTHLPSAEVRDLYAMADVLAHGALSESFGLVLVEALSTGLMVLAHDAPHFEWLLGGREHLVDMSREGALRDRLVEIRSDREAWRRVAREGAERVRARFAWDVVAPEYAGMYRRIASLKRGRSVA